MSLNKANFAIIIGCLIALIGCAGTENKRSEKHKATILYFEGGGGQIYPISQGKLIVRSRYYFEKHGYELVFMYLSFPSSAHGFGQRYTEKHFNEIQAKVNKLSEKGYQRIWLMGISAGTFSVTYAGINKINGVEGLIIINAGQYLLFEGLKKIKLPILAMTHEEDSGPLKDMSEDFSRYFPSSIDPQIVVFSGGVTGTSLIATRDGQKFQHGLRGLEKEFAQAVIDFIDSYETYPE